MSKKSIDSAPRSSLMIEVGVTSSSSTPSRIHQDALNLLVNFITRHGHVCVLQYVVKL